MKSSVAPRDHFPSIAGSMLVLSVCAETTDFSAGIDISPPEFEEVLP